MRLGAQPPLRLASLHRRHRPLRREKLSLISTLHNGLLAVLGAVVEGVDDLLVVLLVDQLVGLLPELYRTAEPVLVATVGRLPPGLRPRCADAVELSTGRGVVLRGRPLHRHLSRSRNFFCMICIDSAIRIDSTQFRLCHESLLQGGEDHKHVMQPNFRLRVRI